MNYKTRHNMADRTRARSTEDQAGMAALLAKVKEKRQQATKAQPELKDDGGERTARE